MSEYGPAFFIKRKDANEINEQQQEALLAHVKEIANKLELTDIEDNAVSPEFYDYDNYEQKAVSYLIYAHHVLGMMPEEVRDEQEEADKVDALKIGVELDKLFPDTYEYDCYHVEC